MHSRTLNSMLLQAARSRGSSYPVNPVTTINTKLGIEADAVLPTNEYPAYKLGMIGNGGHSATIGPGGIPIVKTTGHIVKHNGLYSQLPLVVRNLSSDLTAQERQRFALREVKQIDGVSKVIYWARRLVIDQNETPTFYEITDYGTVNESSRVYTQQIADLTPSATEYTNAGANGISTTAYELQTSTQFDFTAWDCAELLNACEVLYGTPDLAFISEIAIATGFDKSVTRTASNGGQFTFNECVGVQIMNFISDRIPVTSNTTGFTYRIPIGGSEPALSVSE